MKGYDEEDGEVVLAAIAYESPGRNGWLRANCPFCLSRVGKEDRKKTLSFKGGYYTCWRCSATGWVESYDRDKDAPSPPVVPASDMKLTPEYVPLWQEPYLSSESCREPIAYLAGRGIGLDKIRCARIGAALSGRYAGRVIVPIVVGGAVKGFSARDWTAKAKLTYRYPPGMARGQILYNQDALLADTEEPLCVVEGAFDALHLWPNAVAVLGKPSEEHIALLKEASRPLAVILDADAYMDGWTLAMQFKLAGKRACNIVLPPKKDPDEIPVDELRAMVQTELASDGWEGRLWAR